MKYLLILLFGVFGLQLQNNASLERAIRLKNDGMLEESLAIFQELLKTDSANADYLWNASFILCRLGNRFDAEQTRQDYFHRAEYFAKKAIASDPKNADAHYAYALSLGRMNEFAGNRQKIANAKLVKNECDVALKINPKHAGAYHILGRWHRTIAGFNFMEKAMINAFFGGVPPGGSYKDAIDCFSKAVLLEPGNMLHKYELAETYSERGENGDDILCRIWCKKTLEMSPHDIDDQQTLEKAKRLLKKVE